MPSPRVVPIRDGGFLILLSRRGGAVTKNSNSNFYVGFILSGVEDYSKVVRGAACSVTDEVEVLYVATTNSFYDSTDEMVLRNHDDVPTYRVDQGFFGEKHREVRVPYGCIKVLCSHGRKAVYCPEVMRGTD